MTSGVEGAHGRARWRGGGVRLHGASTGRKDRPAAGEAAIASSTAKDFDHQAV